MTDHQFMMICSLLVDIREAITSLTMIEELPDDGECSHPDDARISLATPGDPFHWICNICRFEHTNVRQN